MGALDRAIKDLTENKRDRNDVVRNLLEGAYTKGTEPVGDSSPSKSKASKPSEEDEEEEEEDEDEEEGEEEEEEEKAESKSSRRAKSSK